MKQLFPLVSLALYGCSGCVGLAVTPPRAYSEVRSALVHVYQQTLTEEGVRRSAGTGWAVEHTGLGSLILTAGHMCVDHDGPSVVSVTAQGTQTEVDALPIYWRLGEVDDVCVLWSDLFVPSLLGVSTRSGDALEIGERVWYMGYPADNLLSVVEGMVTVGGDRFVRYSMQTSPGASGSPIIDSSGLVVGLVVRVNTEFKQISYGSSPEQMRDALSQAHRKVEAIGAHTP